MKYLSNWGALDYTQCGSLSLFPKLELYYKPQYITNLIYMSAVTSKYCVTMYSEVEYVIVVHLGRNRNIKFNWYVNGLYYFNNADV